MQTDFEKLTDDFEKCEIDAEAYSHIRHVGVAFTILTRYDFLTANQIYSTNTNKIATAAGAADKFHVTITLAFLSIIAERMQAGDYSDAQDFIDRNPDLINQNPLRKHYSAERMMSEQARKTFLLPDLAA